MEKQQCYAIVPAAGRSSRMGTPKLLLPWPTKARPDGALIDQVLAAWRSSLVTRTVVVVHPSDRKLHEMCQAWDVDLLVPDLPPPDMTSSLQAGLRHIEAEYSPSESAGCFIGPSDLPNLQTQVIDQIWGHALQNWPAAKDRPCVWTPRFGQQSGHPALLPWNVAVGIRNLPSGTGADSFVRSQERRFVDFPESMMIDDCDTPEEYRRALERLSQATDVG